MRDRILKTLAGWHSGHPWRMLALSLLLTVVLGGFAARLTVTMRTTDLLPQKDPRVVMFNRILDEFATSTSLVVVVQGEETRIKAFADELAPRILALKDESHNQSYAKTIAGLEKKLARMDKEGDGGEKIARLKSRIAELRRGIDRPLFQRVDYKADTGFLREHMLMLIKEEDLGNSRDLFFDPNLAGLLRNLNDSMEKEYVRREESISTREKEDGAFAFLDGIQQLTLTLRRAAEGAELKDTEVGAAVDKLLFGEPYMISYDKSTLILFAVPDFTLMDRDLLMTGTETVQELINGMQGEFPGVTAGLSGDIAREHDEQVYSEKSLGSTTVFALIAILALLMISFRMWTAPVFAVLNLVVGLIWAMGASYLAVRQLNMLTSMMSIILLGLGIDFSIHLISTFTERRASGEEIPAALESTFLKSGRGIITGALTTACAFLSLMISAAQGMRQMGIVTGLGLLSILLATLMFLPGLLVLRERRVDRKSARKPGTASTRTDLSFGFLGRLGMRLGRGWIFTLTAASLFTLVMLGIGKNIGFDHNYMNMEPEGLTSIELMDTVLDKFDLSMQYALVLAEGVEESRRLSKAYRDMGTVAQTDDISFYLPSTEQQALRTPHIEEVRRRMNAAAPRPEVEPEELGILRAEIDRLEMNVMEMQDMAFLGGQDKVDAKCRELVGDPERPDDPSLISGLLKIVEGGDSPGRVLDGFSRFQRAFAPRFRESVLRMSSLSPIGLKDLPVEVLDRYGNRDRDVFLVTVYPEGNPWEDARYLDRFVADLEKVSDNATGIPPLSLALIRIFGRDGRNAMLLTLAIVFLLLWADFRRVSYALAAMIPLACGVTWMLGLMQMLGMKLSVINVMGLPLIIGIGIDDGVHIIHRWLHEGPGRMRAVFASTGKAILLTSLTTMLAFGSLVFSIFPGWVQFGGALFIGVGACFLTTVIFLAGIIGLRERKSSAVVEKRNRHKHSGL